jgi:putative membrane protein
VIGDALVAVVALIHVYIVVLEMVLWEKPQGLRAFGTTPRFAHQTRVLAANQGLYNGFLAAGLLWGLWPWTGGGGEGAKIFFLCCVIVAGLYGAATVGPRILFVQAVPAALALLAVLVMP